MIPQDFNVEEFAQALAGQAAEAFPPELPEEVKKIVTQVVYEFIKIAGNALNGEEHSYDQNETLLVCQLVGEWMFHKGIDNYKNQIPNIALRDGKPVGELQKRLPKKLRRHSSTLDAIPDADGGCACSGQSPLHAKRHPDFRGGIRAVCRILSVFKIP